MSGGEQQMCAIGRALMSQPEVLLMDEPSAGLAPLAVEQVFELVRRIRAEGFTVLIVEQNVQQVLDLVDRAYLLEAGRIQLSGTAAEFARQRRDPQSLYGDLTMADPASAHLSGELMAPSLPGDATGSIEGRAVR